MWHRYVHDRPAGRRRERAPHSQCLAVSVNDIPGGYEYGGGAGVGIGTILVVLLLVYMLGIIH